MMLTTQQHPPEASARRSLSEIPTDELLRDFHEASKDLQVAEIAVGIGKVEYRYRIDGNKKQLQVIQGEIRRRIEIATDLRHALRYILSGWDANDRVCPASMMPGIDLAREALRKMEGGAT